MLLELRHRCEARAVIAQIIKQSSKQNENADTSILAGIRPWAVVDSHRYCVVVQRQRASLLE
jgi:hypothetical protein